MLGVRFGCCSTLPRRPRQLMPGANPWKWRLPCPHQDSTARTRPTRTQDIQQPAPATTTALRAALHEHVAIVQAIGRRAAESVRDLGVALAAAKGDCRHGEWLPFLAAAGVPERFAQRAIRYSKLLPKSVNLSDLPAPSKLLGEAATPYSTGDLARDCSALLQDLLVCEAADKVPKGTTAAKAQEWIDTINQKFPGRRAAGSAHG